MATDDSERQPSPTGPRVSITKVTGGNERGDDQRLSISGPGSTLTVELREGRIHVPSNPKTQLHEGSDRYVRSVARPEGGRRIERYAGTRVGRDGRPVYREATYDPETDEASERVVLCETGEVVVDKVESLRAKGAARKKRSSAGN